MKPSTPAKPHIEVLRFVQALYDYEAQQDGDLSFKEGDRIAVICDGKCVVWLCSVFMLVCMCVYPGNRKIDCNSRSLWCYSFHEQEIFSHIAPASPAV